MMKLSFQFELKELEAFLPLMDKIKAYFKRKDLPVTVEVGYSSEIYKFKISSWGTTTFTFFVDITPNLVTFDLIKQDIAWLHKGKVKDMKIEIGHMIHELGGELI